MPIRFITKIEKKPKLLPTEGGLQKELQRDLETSIREGKLGETVESLQGFKGKEFREQ